MLKTLAAILFLACLLLGTLSCSEESAKITTPPDDEDPAPCVIALTVPNGGETWVEGEQQAITWTISDCGTQVAIELWRAGALVATIADSSDNDGSYTWTAAQVSDSTSGYRVRITDLASGNADDSNADFSIATPVDPAPCTLALTSPNGGESWTAGLAYAISWETSECGEQVALELWRDGSLVAMIADSTDNDGSHSWTAAQAANQAAGYRVRIVDLASESADESNAVFAIAPPEDPAPCVLTLTVPNGGETWTEGEAHAITWTTSDCGAQVTLELWRAGVFAATLVENTANDGSFTWTAAQAGDQSAGYRVRVIDLESENADESNAVFTIAPYVDPTPCTLAVSAPNGGETWVEGDEHTLTWTASDCGAEVGIELLRDGALAATIAASTENDGSYVWTATQADGELTGYRIRVTDLASGATDTSNAVFTIGDAPPNPDNYYCVSPDGTRSAGLSTTDIASFNWANADCYGSIAAAIAAMAPGDQVWINDGTYSESVTLRAEQSGSANNYSVVRARNAGKVRLDGTKFAMIDLSAIAYIEVDGFHITGTGDVAIYVHDASHHFKIRRTGWSERAGLISDESHHGLMEDCYAYGGPHRYAFQVNHGANHIIFRRCLVRWDYSNISEPIACFASYTCDNIYYQNCIAIDGTDNKGIDTGEDGLKSFFTPNGSTNCHYEGCISLAMRGAAGWWMEGSTAEGTLTDCIAWDHLTNAADAGDTYDPYSFASTADYGSWQLDRCTFGINNLGTQPVRFDAYNSESMVNSIIYGMSLNDGEYAVSSHLDEHDYNCYWGNTGNRNQVDGVGPHSLTAVDPLSHGLGSLVDIDAGSTLATAGQGGGRIGARVLTTIGVSGTLHGEAGWDQDTGEPLWPYPNEDQIREACRQFSMPAGAAYAGSPAIDGQRGFCAPGQTLTNYILNYLSRD